MAVILSKTGYEGNYISTGNEYISLPRIDINGSINAVGFFSEEFDSCLEYVGRQNMPFLLPYINIDDKNIIENFDSYNLDKYWIPNFTKTINNLDINWKIFCPITRHGFICLLYINNNGNNDVSFNTGIKGTWSNIFETCKTLSKLDFNKNCKKHAFEPNALTFNIKNISNLYTLSIYCDKTFDYDIDYCSLTTNENENDGSDICYNFNSEILLKKNQSIIIPYYIGIAKKEISSISIVKELFNQGYNNLYNLLYKWLDKHIIDNDNKKIKRLINENSFYNFFYSQAITIDTDKLVITSSRDSRSPYCGLYLDNSSMRFSQKATQLISWTQSRKHLLYSFNIQSEQTGLRSRSINGYVVDYGIQLDAIYSPICALESYIKITGDKSILFSSNVQNNINYIQRLLSAQFHKKIHLLETFLDPNGDYSKFPYICMQNVLAWKSYLLLGELYNIIRDIDKSNEMKTIANSIKDDINKYFIISTSHGKKYAYAIDLKGNYTFTNCNVLPINLMPNFDFLPKDDQIYLNTIKDINDDNETIIDIINYLLTNNHEKIKYYLDILLNKNDYYLKSDPNASLSGYFTYALYQYFGGKLPVTSLASDNLEEALIYRVPEVKLNSKKARIGN